MNPNEPHPSDAPLQEQEPAAPACVLCFNASDPSGAGGIAGDIATVAAMGAHALPVVTGIVLRDTAEAFESQALDDDLVTEQARHILEDVQISAWKVGFLGSAEVVSAVAEVISDYPDVPLITYVPAVTWLDDDELQSYLDALRELVLPLTHVLCGSHKTLMDLLLPDWDNERPASPREIAVAAAQMGVGQVLVSGITLPDQFIDNVLATAQGPVTGEKFERFEAGFVGAGETLSAALASLLAFGVEPHAAVGEALTFLDQSLDAGFRPGMGNVVPDRFFWALPEEESAEAPDGNDLAGFEQVEADPEEPTPPARPTRRMH